MLNEVYEVKIIKQDHFGNGIAKIDNKLVFVDKALPGDICKIKITKVKKNYVNGKILEILQSSNLRVDVKCPYYEICGGCHVMHEKYEQQLLFKENNYSPIFHKIKVEDFLKLSVKERDEFLNNNYNDILIEESDLRKYKSGTIYDMANLSNAKRVQIIVNKSHHDLDNIDNEEYKELSIEELINESISQLDVDDETKGRLKNISRDRLKQAENELNEV